MNRATDGWDEALQPIFDVVRSAAHQGFDSHLFTEHARDEDEGQLRADLLPDL